MRNLLTILLPLSFFTCRSEKLVSDPATVQQLEILTSLPEQISESSGLAFLDNQLWTHNDGGGAAELYAIAQNEASLSHTLSISNAENVDWEELAADNAFLYIGDFGNNRGSRQDLKVYRVDRDSLLRATTVGAVISFSYADQQNFENRDDHDFDCEAMIALEDQLYLFTKNRATEQTHLYALAKIPGTYVVEQIGAFPTAGLITGAAFDPDTRTLCLLGFQEEDGTHIAFVWIFYDFPEQQFFAGAYRKVDLLPYAQMEGITSIGNDQFLISSEDENEGVNGQVFLFDAEDWK